MLSNIKNFFLTFIISLIIFGVIAFLVINMLLGDLGTGQGLDQNGNDDFVDNGNNNNPLVELDGNSFNMLFIGLDYAPGLFYKYYDPTTVSGLADYKTNEIPGELVTDGSYRRISADAILLVCVSKEREEFAFTSISPGTLIERSGTTKCLSDIYEDEGLFSFIDTVRDLVGLPIDRYAVLSLQTFPEIIDELGGVTFNVPCDMKYDDNKGALHINITAGRQTLDGKTALEVLRFNSYEDTNSSRAKTTIDFAKSLMKKMTVTLYKTKAVGILKNIESMIVTNFTASDLNSNLDLIFSYPDFDTVTLELPGKYSTIDGRLCFIPNMNACRNTLAAYKRLN